MKPRMSHPATLLALGAACVLALASLLAFTATAGAAEGYGELTRFGEVSAGGREGLTEVGKLSEARTLALGVDPEEENSVFVLEEAKAASAESIAEAAAATTTRSFRLKKFKAGAKGAYAETASVDFQETSPHLVPEALQQQKPGVDGLVVDAKENRVYLLATDLRKESDALDHTEGGGSEGVLAASTLYAFSTKESGTKLVGAAGTTEGVLAGEATLGPQSDTVGKALLDPRGMTLDPANHELILLAHVDQHGDAVDAVASETDHYVLQRIKPNGTLGTPYVDSTNKLKEKVEGFSHIPTSPVVVPGAGGKESEEHVFVNFAGIAEVPRDFTSTEAPHLLPLSKELNGGTFEQVERGLLGPANPKTDLEYREARAPQGGRLTVSPEGTVFGAAKIELESAGPEGHEGVLAMSGTNGEPIGWSGGGVSQGNGVKKNECVMQPLGIGLAVQVAAGSNGTVFVLAPEFLRQEEEERNFEEIENPPGSEEFEEIELEPTFSPFNERVTKTPAIIEFGPGGTGCAPASAEGPEDEVNGVKKVEEVPAGTEVKFTSSLKQADATKVEWTFEIEGKPETKETVVQGAAEQRGGAAPQPYREPSLKKKFTTNGKYKVTETIYSDDLASPSTVYENGHLNTPTITLTLKHALTVTPGAPIAAFTWTPGTPTRGEAVKFESKATDPNGPSGQPLEYTWKWGDGTTTGPSTTATATHTFAEGKTYNVVLEVKNKLGKTTSVEHAVTVKEGETQEEKEKHEKELKEKQERELKEKQAKELKEKQEREQKEKATGGGGAGGGGGTGGGGGSTGGGGSGGGEVLASKASIAGSSVSVSPTGSFTIKVNCAGQSSCAGTITLRTAGAVAASKKRIVTLATVSFSIAGGQVKALKLHLSAKARALLKRTHTLKVKATVVSSSSGKTQTTVSTVTLKAAKHR